MRNTTTRRAAVAALGLCCGAAIAVPSAALAASGHAAAKQHGKGFYLANQNGTEKVTSVYGPAGSVVDPNGNRHVVSLEPSANATGNQGHIVYSTRANESNKWKSHRVPGLRPLDGMQLQLGLSGDQR